VHGAHLGVDLGTRTGQKGRQWGRAAALWLGGRGGSVSATRGARAGQYVARGAPGSPKGGV
jgi:hypothetical protein